MKQLDTILGDKIPGKLTLMTFAIFLCGSAIPYQINIVGQISLAEFLLPLLAILLMNSPATRKLFSQRVFTVFLLLGILMLFGFIISDMANNTSSEKYVRGWARVIVLVIDFVTMAIIFSRRPNYIWWFVLGAGVGGVLYSALSGAPITQWKFGYGYQIVMIAAVSAVIFGNKKLSLIFLLLMVISIIMDSRSIAGFCVVVAIFLWVRTGKNTAQIINVKGFLKAVVIGILGLMLLLVTLDYMRSELSHRQDQSSTGRFAALSVGLIAIMDSPFIGTGSWGENTAEYSKILMDDLRSQMTQSERSRNMYADIGKGAFRAHSQVIQAWMEGGILAALFFLYFGYRLVKAFMYVGIWRKYDALSPVYTLLMISSLWHFLMSPFGGNHRLGIAISLVIICLLEIEKKTSTKTTEYLSKKTADKIKNKRIISSKRATTVVKL